MSWGEIARTPPPVWVAQPEFDIEGFAKDFSSYNGTVTVTAGRNATKMDDGTVLFDAATSIAPDRFVPYVADSKTNMIAKDTQLPKGVEIGRYCFISPNIDFDNRSYPFESSVPKIGSQTAVISADSRSGPGVPVVADVSEIKRTSIGHGFRIGDHAAVMARVIGADVRIGDNSKVSVDHNDPGTSIGRGTNIAVPYKERKNPAAWDASGVIESHVGIGENVTIGDNVYIGNSARVFWDNSGDDRRVKAQAIGDDVRIERYFVHRFAFPREVFVDGEITPFAPEMVGGMICRSFAMGGYSGGPSDNTRVRHAYISPASPDYAKAAWGMVRNGGGPVDANEPPGSRYYASHEI